MSSRLPLCRSYAAGYRYSILFAPVLGCLLIACNQSQFEDNRKTGRSPAATSGSESNSGESSCLFVRSGDVLTREQRDEYASTGRIDMQFTNGASLCSGALIRPNVVLTAQHCIADTESPNLTTFNPNQLTFVMTSGDRDPMTVSQVIPWSSDVPNDTFRDVGLMILAEDVDERVPIYDVMQTSLQAAPVAANNPMLTMIGYGGYTDGNNVATYKVAKRHIG